MLLLRADDFFSPLPLEPLISIVATLPASRTVGTRSVTKPGYRARQESVRRPFRGPRLSSERPTATRWNGDGVSTGPISLPNLCRTIPKLKFEKLTREKEIDRAYIIPRRWYNYLVLIVVTVFATKKKVFVGEMQFNLLETRQRTFSLTFISPNFQASTISRNYERRRCI